MNKSQQIQPPFQNKYNLRSVSSQDSKSCLICYKPTTEVLITDNHLDFFYICKSHLYDESFAKPIESKEYEELKNEITKLEIQLKEVGKKVEETKPYLWGINWSKDKKKKEEDKDKDKEDDKSKNNNHESYKSKLKEIENNLTTKNEELKNFKFKSYNLSSTIYKNRLMLNQKKKYNKERIEKIQKDGFFPTVPTHEISK
ncbi:uncharacterized protein KGF55_003772 [Candida pseudojiufengensis]|uniref:uncharacterized protein n=1 Tax=Candida pseudojiufengensis TaxID=497109 RepID=UPI0022256996|nr:uncharacterized protein KGF55_003772 [Candida pseudojiufengensis]KAI5962696.1 hypothetical protein KGF55_003772 [Candida pseudojiufengensis]